MLSGLWNLENVMMMPNTLGLFEQLVPFNFTNFIKDTKKKKDHFCLRRGYLCLVTYHLNNCEKHNVEQLGLLPCIEHILYDEPRITVETQRK